MLDFIFNGISDVFQGFQSATIFQKIVAVMILLVVGGGISAWVGGYLLLAGGILQFIAGVTSDPRSATAILIGIIRVFISFPMISAGIWAGIFSTLLYFKRVGSASTASTSPPTG